MPPSDAEDVKIGESASALKRKSSEGGESVVTGSISNLGGGGSKKKRKVEIVSFRLLSFPCEYRH